MFLFIYFKLIFVDFMLVKQQLPAIEAFTNK